MKWIHFRQLSALRSACLCAPATRPMRALCTGGAGGGAQPLLMAALHELEHCHIYSLDLPALVADGSRTPHEACAHIFAEVRNSCA